MDTAKLEQGIREALGHLYDPDYEPPELLRDVLRPDPHGGPLQVQAAIRQALDGLKPPESTPTSALARRMYELLHKRFVLGLTLEETAHDMHLSVTSAWRVQRAAIHALTQVLWSQRGQAAESRDQAQPVSSESTPSRLARAQGPSWQTQTQRELASLDLTSPGAVADIGEAIAGVVDLKGLLDPGQGVWIEVESVQPNLIAAVHPSALRQLLITAVRRLAKSVAPGPIGVFAGLEDGSIRITLTATLADGQRVDPEDLFASVLRPEQVSFDYHADGRDVSLRARMPSAEEPVTVLVIDDNPDMVHFHRRSMAGTRYHMLALSDAVVAFDTIEAAEPGAIILDVMLPGMDGWVLLTHLHNDDRTRHIPVIVCTVVREEELALSLGAARFLSKPVRRRDLLRALDEITLQV